MIERFLQLFRPVEIELKQKLHGAFARLTSYTHAANMRESA